MPKTKDPNAARAKEAFEKGQAIVSHHPLFRPLHYRVQINRRDNNLCPREGWALVTANGVIHVHATRLAEPEEWAYVLAHCLLHLAFDHFKVRRNFYAWNVACDAVITKFLQDVRLGRPPEEMKPPQGFSAPDEGRLYQRFVADGISEDYRGLGTGAPSGNDMVMEAVQPITQNGKLKPPDWASWFASGLVSAVSDAVDIAGGIAPSAHDPNRPTKSLAEQARQWFMSSYPLLGSLAAAFKIVEKVDACARYDIVIAAVSAEQRELYVNPDAGLSLEELKFVMAHELLHVALRHSARGQWREPYLWNVACDFVINEWLMEMNVGQMPRFGGLHDPDLKGLNAEAIYDIIVNDLRRFRRVATLRGVGRSDMLDNDPDWWRQGRGADLDEFYRRCLGQGLGYHQSQGRGFLPAGLIEEIRAQAQPPVVWDVELAHWFDAHFPPIEKRQSYARLSRRQSSTPDIPRPRYVPDERYAEGRTFGVVLDTSGSMSNKVLANALGAIASYSLAREVHAVRVVFCDAMAYDKGYMSADEIAGRVQVRGRGGTVLQPGVDLLHKADDFPKEGPILVITDGVCEDRLAVPRDHAFLVPRGQHLPFVPKGPVFWMA